MRADIARIERKNPDRPPKFRIFHAGSKGIIVCDFDRVFGINRPNLNVFHIIKSSFYSKANLICDTINFLMMYYDEDKELLTSYLNMKALIDLNNLSYSYNSFRNDLVNTLFTDSMVKKIKLMVDEQYRVDLEVSKDTDRYKDNPQQFTNRHGKILMAISTALKVAIPIVSHYYVARGDMVRDKSLKEYLYNCFYSLFPLFEDGTNMYAKIYATAEKQVSSSVHQDGRMWERNENKGTTPILLTTVLTKMVIQDLMFKYVFTNKAINLNLAGIKKMIRNEITTGKDTRDYVDTSSKKSNGEKMSGLEQLEMNAAKLDEQHILIATQGSSNKIKRLSVKYDVEIKPKQLDFYKDNLVLSITQKDLILQFFAEDFGGTENQQYIKRKDFFRLLIIVKKILQRRGFMVLPDLLSGNPSTTIRSRKIGAKSLNKMKAAPLYSVVTSQYADASSLITDKLVLGPIATLINSPMTYVNHKKPELLGQDIEISEELVKDECLRFMAMI